ncbi:MAG: peptidase [Nitrospirae bacterium]|nr:peptidase [Nitrospirota bacterium]
MYNIITDMRTYIVLLIVLLFPGICMAANTKYTKPDIPIDKNQLYSSVEKLTGLNLPRNYGNIVSLNRAADFIKSEFLKYGYKPVEQKYSVDGVEYKNIIATYGPETAPRFIVGAHYDVAGDQPGADDNASGIAGLLSLAELFKEHSPKINFRIDFVAFTLEEPPFFKTKQMGSFIHASSLHDEKANVLGMVSLEMIGYYSDAWNSQLYPVPLMRLFYPSKGNFIGVVGNFASSGLIRHFRNVMKLAAVDVESLKAPSFLIGVDFSDHMNYWKFGYPAIMITDTAFYRNPNYHSESDTVDTLNFDKMKEVVKGLYWALVNLEPE